MELTQIEHIGIATPSLEEAIPYYENVLGLKCYSIEEVADQKVKTAFFRIGEVKLELLEPTCEESTIAKFIEKNGGRGGIHHIAYKTKDVAAFIGEAAEKGVKLIDTTPRAGAEGLNIAFLHPKSTMSVLTEICENPAEK